MPNTVTVSAGDTIGASPLISANYLDEPTITAMNLLGLEFNSVGNHEFDRGATSSSGCRPAAARKFTRRKPCAVEPFARRAVPLPRGQCRAGGRHDNLPGDRHQDSSDRSRIGFIGMTLKGTANLVTPSGVKGLHFRRRSGDGQCLGSASSRRRAPTRSSCSSTRAERRREFTTGNGCDGLYGDILPILPKLDPAITTVVSGHTHWAYVCNGTPETGAGRLTDQRRASTAISSPISACASIPQRTQLIGQNATNVVVGNGERGIDPAGAGPGLALCRSSRADRQQGHWSADGKGARPIANDGESPAADLIADATLAATRSAQNGGAQIALVNATGVRVALPAGDVPLQGCVRDDAVRE